MSGAPPAAAAGGGAAAHDPVHPSRASGWLPVLAAAALYALATPWVLRPWFLAQDLLPHSPGAIGTMVDADLFLNVWILAWIAHAALNDPSRLYDGNVFYPATNTIAGSENMLAHLPVTAPALALSGNALVMLKAYVLECFVLSGVAMFLFVRHHTRSNAAALLGGAAFTFTFFRASTIPQPQYLGIQFLPLALLFVDLWLERRRARWLVLLALALGLQALSCVYIGFFTLIVVPVYAGVRLLDVRDRPARAGGALLLAFAAGVAASFPAALPYLRARAEGMIPRHDPAMIRWFSWQPWDYLSRGFLERAGLVPVALVVVDLLLRAGRRLRATAARRAPDRSVERALWAVAATGVVLSAGPSLEVFGLSVPLPYRALYELVPGFSSIRVPIRFAIVVAAALAALAGLAFARWTRTLAPRTRLAAAAALALACVVDAAPRPVPVTAAGLGAATAPAYRWLAAQPGNDTVLELPGTASGDDVLGNARSGRYMVASTVHWKPLVNGWTAYPPHVAPLLAAAIRDLPADDALGLLVDGAALRWLLVHRDQLTPEESARLPHGALPGLRLVANFGDTEVYEVERPRVRDLRAALTERSRTPSTTSLGGVATAPLADACRKARIDTVDAPARVLPIPAPRRVTVRFTNESACPWPALGVRPEGLVSLGYRWTSPSGAHDPPGAVARLLHDVAAGATVETTMLVTPPTGEPGPWQLEVMLFQQGGGAPLATASRTVELRAPGGATPAAQAGGAGSSS